MMRGGQVEIERNGNRVIVTLHLAGDYEAISAYETLIQQARDGLVLLDIETVPRPQQELGKT